MKKEIQFQLFGVFRDLQSDGSLQLQTTLPISVKDLKTLLAEKLVGTGKVDVKALLKSSAIATDQKVLGEEEMIEQEENLALLPPVCGG